MASSSTEEERRSRLRRTADRVGTIADSTYRYRLLMYIALVLWTSFLFWRIQEDREDGREKDAAITAELLEEVNQQAIARDYLICVRSNDARRGIQVFIEQLVTSDDGVIDAREQRVLDLARERFAVDECPPPPAEVDTEIKESRGR